MSSLRWIIGWTMTLFVLLLVAYLGFSYASIWDQNPDHQRIFQVALMHLPEIARTLWNFIRPFVQLVLVLLIVDWILGRWGISFKSKIQELEWNVQTMIALIVIGAFSIAALGGIGGADALKDLALVVVGFYFGTQRRTMQLQSPSGAISLTEEHDNPRVRDAPGESGKNKSEEREDPIAQK